MKAILQGFYQKEHFWLRLGVVLLAVFGMGFALSLYNARLLNTGRILLIYSCTRSTLFKSSMFSLPFSQSLICNRSVPAQDTAC